MQNAHSLENEHQIAAERSKNNPNLMHNAAKLHQINFLNLFVTFYNFL